MVEALRASGVDVLTTQEAGQLRASDESQLAFATSEGRVLYTTNCADFAALHARWMSEGRPHSGLVMRAQQQLPPVAQIKALRRICSERTGTYEGVLFEYLESWL